jgi:(p)ppGpp synthase/HD superfamily hydrolase
MATFAHENYRPLLEAAAFAARAHGGQLRKDGQTPYASHVFRVCLVVREYFGIADRNVLMTALLHDTVEDTTTDFDDLEEHFGPEIAHWVALLSKDKRLQEEERERAYMAQLAGAPWQVKACKLADIFDNLMDLGKLASKDRPRILNRLEGYWSCLRADAHENLRRPLEMVGALLKELRAPSPAS